jgi:mannose-6-phosphate isomerase-like protein (cupin superfamily)
MSTDKENQESQPLNLIVRDEDKSVKETSACGHRYRLLSHEDEGLAAWAHAVDIDGAKLHYHKKSTELYYVLEGQGTVSLDGKEEHVKKGTIIHIPPGVVHGANGKMRVLVIGIPDIDDSDIYYV